MSGPHSVLHANAECQSNSNFNWPPIESNDKFIICSLVIAI